MPRRHIRPHNRPLDPNLTPLLDIVLQLITFFMMLIHFGTRIEGENTRVRLPVAPAALPAAGASLDRLLVTIDAAGRLLDEQDAARAGDASRAWWRSQAAQRRSARPNVGGPLPTQVILRADRSVPYGVVRRTLAEAQSEGFSRFSLVVLREARNDPATP